MWQRPVGGPVSAPLVMSDVAGVALDRPNTLRAEASGGSRQQHPSEYVRIGATEPHAFEHRRRLRETPRHLEQARNEIARELPGVMRSDNREVAIDHIDPLGTRPDSLVGREVWRVPA